MVNSVKPDIVFITGDLYDGAGRELGLLATPLNDIKPPLGIYNVIGNHETYINVDHTLKALKETSVTTLRYHSVAIEGVQIIGVDYHMPGKKRDVSEAVKLIDKDTPTIVLYHEPFVSAVNQFREAGVRLALSGHTHKGQLWPFGFITKAMYKQYDCGYYQDGNFIQYTSTGIGTWGPPMRTGNRPEVVVIAFTK